MKRSRAETGAPQKNKGNPKGAKRRADAKAKSMAEAKAMVSHEKKLQFVDYGINVSLVNTVGLNPSGGIYNWVQSAGGNTGGRFLNRIASGPGQSERLGDQAEIKSVYINGAVHFQRISSGSVAALDVRPILVALCLDTRVNKAVAPLPEAGAVYVNPSYADGANDVGVAVAAQRNLAETKRFKVLDSYLCVPLVTPGLANGAQVEMPGQMVHFTLNWKGSIITNYDGSTSADSAILDNGFFMCVLSNEPTANSYAIQAACRTRFLK